jgi:methionyl-tRNA synthetase
VLAFVRQGLQDLSISRERSSVSWGIPVPGDDDHVMYVWLDALSNYITALGYGNEEGKGFDRYWPEATHFVGKDILRFHTVYWWSFLKAAGLSLPKTVFAHGMWLDSQGRKMSKTLGNGIELPVLMRHFQTDAVRYFLLREMVFGQDGNFGYEGFIERCNADLANGLGNLAARTISMLGKYREGVVPSGHIGESGYLAAKRAGLSTDDQDLASALAAGRDEYLRRFDSFEFHLALEGAWTVIRKIDTMISDSKPWDLVKSESAGESLNAVLYRASEALRWLSVLLNPVMPEATVKIWRQLGLAGDPCEVNPESLEYGGLQPGTVTAPGEIIFPRIDKQTVMSEIEATKEPTTEAQTSVAESIDKADDNFITIDDFLKVEMRVGEIKVAERIPNADKLLRFEIDLGEGRLRQILAGLAEYYEPEKLIGRRVVVVANLKPRKMRGLESQGMICAASLEGGADRPAVATFIESVEIGARLK